MSSINLKLGRQKNHRAEGLAGDPEKAALAVSHRCRPTGFQTPGKPRPAVPTESGLYGSEDSSRFYPQNQSIFVPYGNFVQQLL